MRGLKFLNNEYKPSPGFKLYSAELEAAIAKTLTSVPDPKKVYKNEDGTPKTPSDETLKQAAALGALVDVQRATLMDRFKLTNEQALQLNKNSYLMEDYFLNGRHILDKIPVADPVTGEVTWTIVREDAKEGWEPLMYYMFVPGLMIALFFYFFLDRQSLDDWAMEELRARAQARFGDASTDEGLSPEEKKKRDDLIVERIISGEYDKLAGLQKAGSDLPSNLL